MKKRIFTVAFLLSALLCWPRSWSIENPGIGNPIGPSTVPPSTFRNGLVNTPSPIDRNGNLLITGNVRRGKHFRGDVPYQSPTSFGSSLGSSSLSSFLRDTAGQEDFQVYSNNYGTQPYYSPTETVTTMIPGRSEVFSPAGTRMNTRVQQDTRSAETGVSGLEFQHKGQALFDQFTTAADSDLQRPITQYGPLAQSRLMLESKFPTDNSLNRSNTAQMIPAQIGVPQQSETTADELFKKQVQEITGRTQSTKWPGSSSATVPGPERQESLWEKNESYQYSSQASNNENLGPKFNVQAPSQTFDSNGKQTAYAHQGISALEQFKPSDTSSQKNLFLQKGINWPDSSQELTMDQEQVSKDEQGQGDVLERVRQQLEDLTKSLDTAVQSRGLGRETTDGLKKKHDKYQGLSNERSAKQEEIPLEHQRYMPESRQRINLGSDINSYKQQRTGLSFESEEPVPNSLNGLSQTDNGRQSALEFNEIPNYTNSQKRSSQLQELNKLSQAEISAEANRIMGPYNSIESLSESKFNLHMQEAEEHLKAGGYYRAASSFSLALIYKADNPQALAGRGHALLAIGEYVSSSLFLSRALEVNPEYLRTKVDLAALLGGENKLAERIADIEQWLARSGSSQLQFLLGYVYYQTGQLQRAKQVIDAAYEKTPDSPAVQVMKIAVDNRMLRQ